MTDSKMKSQSLQKWFSVLLLIALIVEGVKSILGTAWAAIRAVAA